MPKYETFSNFKLPVKEATNEPTNVFSMCTDIWYGTTVDRMNEYFPILRDIGFEYIRFEFSNDSLSNLRQIVPLAVNNGFKILGLLMERSYAPTNINGWGNWVYSIINEFKDYVQLWECWNEPNQANTFFNGGTASQYAQFLKECYIRGKEADPNCIILGGSVVFTHTNSLNYLRTIYDTIGIDYMDGLAWHPYCNPYAPDDELNTPNPFIYLTKVRDVMLEYNDSNDIWITELGWQSDSPLTEELQSQYTIQALNYVRTWDWVKFYCIYKLIDSGTNLKGILNGDLTHKILYDNLKVFISDMNLLSPAKLPFYTENLDKFIIINGEWS